MTNIIALYLILNIIDRLEVILNVCAIYHVNQMFFEIYYPTCEILIHLYITAQYCFNLVQNSKMET